MGQFFGSIYCWFEDFFGLELANYMWGVTSPYQGANMFIGIGLWMLGISLCLVVLYYLILDHPRLCRWWGWFIFLVVDGLINFFVGWQRLLSDYYGGKMVYLDSTTDQEVPLNITEANCLAFGVSNLMISIMFFFVFSMMIKWFSTNCSRAPFVK